MKNIIFIYSSSSFAYNFTKEIVIETIKNNHNVIVIFPDDEYQEEFIKIGCQIIYVDIDRRGTNIFKDYKLYKNYVKIFKKIKPDLIFGFTIKPNIYGAQAAKKFRIPFVARISGLGTSFQSNNIMFYITRFLYRRSFSKIKFVFFENKDNYEIFSKKVKHLENSKVIPGSGVNIDEFNYQTYPKNTGVIKFLFIGRIMFEKGIDDYLYAASKLKDKYKDNIEFHIVGRQEENYSDVLLKLEKTGIIKYHGVNKNIKNFIRDSNCIVLPSHHEGLSNAMLEALSCGRPVIGSDIPGIRETFENNVSGLSFEVKNREELAVKIEEFYNYPYSKKEEMGKQGRFYIENNYNRKIVIKEYLDQIKELQMEREP